MQRAIYAGTVSGTGSFALSTPERRALVAAGDGIGAALACALAYLSWESEVGRALVVPKLGPLFFAAVWMLALFMVDGYDIQTPASRVRSVAVVLKAAPLASVFGFIAFFAQPYRMARPVVVLSVLIGALLVVGMRWTAARLLLHSAFAKRAILVGSEGVMSSSLGEALESSRYEYRVVATCSANDVAEVARRFEAQEAIVANDDPAAVRAAVEACFSQGIRVVCARDLIERFEGRVSLTWIDESWFLTLPAQTLSNRPYFAVRRAIDVIGAVILGLPFLLILPLVAALIKLDSPGPVFFRQRRMGRHGRLFFIPKLRTMRTDAELAGYRWTSPDDPRVTRVGRLLRITRVDEIPQVLNILRGEMSFIGPRPERPEFFPALQAALPHFRARLAVRPGLSGWAQVKTGYAASVADSRRKLEYDLYYVKNQSLRLDLQIALHTIFTVLGLRGR